MCTIATMRLLGGRPCLDFVNTVHSRRDLWGPDLLADFEDLLVWCERLDLLSREDVAAARIEAAQRPDQAAAALIDAKQLREAVYAVLTASIARQQPPEPSWSNLCQAIDHARAFRSFARSSSTYEWSWRGESPLDRPSHRIAWDCADLLTNEDVRRRLKECFGPNCGWLFIDNTRNQSRRWCSEETCGTHVRVRRHREKARSGE